MPNFSHDLLVENYPAICSTVVRRNLVRCIWHFSRMLQPEKQQQRKKKVWIRKKKKKLRNTNILGVAFYFSNSCARCFVCMCVCLCVCVWTERVLLFCCFGDRWQAKPAVIRTRTGLFPFATRQRFFFFNLTRRVWRFHFHPAGLINSFIVIRLFLHIETVPLQF